MDIHPIELARQAIAYVQPLLMAAGGKLAQDAVNEGRKALWAWLKEKLSGAAAQETIREIEAAPEEATHWTVLEACLERALKDEAFREALAAQLAQVPPVPGHVQTATVTGNGAVAQIQGDNNSVQITR